MTNQQAWVPTLISDRGARVSDQVIAMTAGVAGLAILAQVAIRLPWTPVPITGQTFGVALISLLWGRTRGVTIVATYLALGFLGLPLFAGATAGFLMGPTSGYLLGMLLASAVMGTFADHGWTNSLTRTWFATFCGSVVTFGCGAAVLSFYLPANALLWAGVVPFLPGDLVKTLVACVLVRQISQTRARSAT